MENVLQGATNTKRVLIWLLPLFVIGIAAITYVGLEFAKTIQYETALSAARTYSKTITAVRDQYIETMKATTAKLPKNAFGHGAYDGPPVAYTILSDVSEKLPDLSAGRFRIFSQYPWPNRSTGGPQNDLERELLHRITTLGEQEVMIEIRDEKMHGLVYASPIVMKEGCINCHNNHPESPRQGWQVGDVRGVQFTEVVLPSAPFIPGAATMHSVLTLVGLVALALLGFWFLGSRMITLSNKLEKQSLLNQVVQSMGDGVICLKSDGTIIEFNSAAEDLLGYFEEELLGAHITKLMSVNDAVKHQAGFQAFMASGGKGHNPRNMPAEVTAIAKSGEQIPVSMILALVNGIDAPMVVGSLRDLRPLKKHRHISHFLEATFDSMDQGVMIYDQDLNLVSWNKRCKELDIGIDHKFLQEGANLLDLYRESAATGVLGPGDPEEIAQSHIDAVIQGPLIKTEILRSKSGGSVRINRFRLPNGGICATFRDVTDELQVEEQLRQAHKMEAVGKLAGGIAHDFNNILTVVIGHTQALLKDASSNTESLQSVLDAAERGTEITHRLLAFSRQQPLRAEVVEFKLLLESLSLLIQSAIGERIKLQTSIPDGVWQCKVDRAQLEATLLNLSVNARDAMENGGQLLIDVSNQKINNQIASSLGLEHGDYVCIKVADTGAGMPKEIREHAFDPFFTTKPEGKGTGLGLAMVYGFVKQSDGAISIDSTSQGTSVNIYLPRSKEALESISLQKNSDITIANGSDGVVLIVEDQPDVRSLLINQIESLGYHALAASDGEEAVELLESELRIDIMLTDVGLPGAYNGWELAHVATTVRPDFYTVIMSGYSESLPEKMLMNNKPVFLQKPFDMDKLHATLRAGMLH